MLTVLLIVFAVYIKVVSVFLLKIQDTCIDVLRELEGLSITVDKGKAVGTRQYTQQLRRKQGRTVSINSKDYSNTSWNCITILLYFSPPQQHKASKFMIYGVFAGNKFDLISCKKLFCDTRSCKKQLMFMIIGIMKSFKLDFEPKYTLAILLTELKLKQDIHIL